jgi:hypothetical protein
VKNTLAYYSTELIMVLKCYIILAPGANRIKLLLVNSNKRFCKLDCFSTIPKTVYSSEMVKLTIGGEKMYFKRSLYGWLLVT